MLLITKYPIIRQKKFEQFQQDIIIIFPFKIKNYIYNDIGWLMITGALTIFYEEPS
jgi:hypothetical protein